MRFPIQLLAAALACAMAAGCASRRAMERAYYITGQTLDIAEGHALIDFGADKQAKKGTRLIAFRVAEEETHESTERLSRVRLETVGLLEVVESTRFRSIARIVRLDESAEMAAEAAGLYVRLAPKGELPESWWETAAEWWNSFPHRGR